MARGNEGHVGAAVVWAVAWRYGVMEGPDRGEIRLACAVGYLGGRVKGQAKGAKLRGRWAQEASGGGMLGAAVLARRGRVCNPTARLQGARASGKHAVVGRATLGMQGHVGGLAWTGASWCPLVGPTCQVHCAQNRCGV